ncbi:hypothetical protein GOP47_0008919 [Adiantum capillus-veneris]|uniref:Uncharacterized protein n=1 Tax=Adiantum capillus-veneris TaxID=13818 RepID=A0A9D4ZIL6_ADICA|nr:hypothetical protein GOP47_0008919 [Adiantum capillus-veneris]
MELAPPSSFRNMPFPVAFFPLVLKGTYAPLQCWVFFFYKTAIGWRVLLRLSFCRLVRRRFGTQGQVAKEVGESCLRIGGCNIENQVGGGGGGEGEHEQFVCSTLLSSE